MRRAVVIGDSNTYGFDPAGAFGGRFPETVRFIKVLERRLCEEWEIVGLGLNGREIPHTAAELESLDRTLEESSPIDVLYVMLGTNDYLNMFDPDIPQVIARLKGMMERVEASESIRHYHTELVLIAPAQVMTGADEYYAKYDTRDGRLSRAYQRLAEERRWIFLDAASWNLPLAYDGVHFSERAHLLFADRLEEHLNRMKFQLDWEEEEARKREMEAEGEAE